MTEKEIPQHVNIDELPEMKKISLNRLIELWLEEKGYSAFSEHDGIAEWFHINRLCIENGMDVEIQINGDATVSVVDCERETERLRDE